MNMEKTRAIIDAGLQALCGAKLNLANHILPVYGKDVELTIDDFSNERGSDENFELTITVKPKGEEAQTNITVIDGISVYTNPQLAKHISQMFLTVNLCNLTVDLGDKDKHLLLSKLIEEIDRAMLNAL